MAKERSLDIFELLPKIDQKDLHIWEKLSDEQRKEFSPLVVLKWLRGTDNLTQLEFLNELVNPVIFTLGQEKEFILKLMAICTFGGRKRYSWLSTKSNKKKSTLKIDMIMNYNHISKRESMEVVSLYNEEEILQMAEEIGYQKDEITALKKELKNG